MAGPGVVLDLWSRLEEKEGRAELIPSAGGTLSIDLGDLEAEYSIDYMEPDRLVLEVRGKFRLDISEGIELSARAGMARDLIEGERSFDGKLKLEFDSGTAVSIDMKKDEKGGSVKVGLKVRV